MSSENVERTLRGYEAFARESGAVVEAPMAHVWTIRDGQAIRLRQFLDREQALEAAGLSE
jgi:ketosteroid isomerase-like protein